MALDARTIFFVWASLFTAIALAIVFLKNAIPKMPGVNKWLFGSTGLAIGIWFVAIQPDLPVAVNVLVGNSIILLSFAMIYDGISLFLNREGLVKFYLVVIALAVLAMAIFVFLQPTLLIQTMVFYLAMAIISARAAMEFFQPRIEKNYSWTWTVAVLILSSLFYLVITALVPFFKTGELGVFAATTLSSTFVFIGMILSVMLIFGLLLMVSQKLGKSQKDESIHDPLTNAFNRSAFKDFLPKALSAADRYDKPLSLAIMHLDRFNAINEEHGPLAGNKVLIEFAELSMQVFREADFFARTGDEEFVAILVGSGSEESILALDRLRRQLAKLKIEWKNHSVSVELSAGIAQWRGKEESAQQLLARADKALFQVKNSGENKVTRSS